MTLLQHSHSVFGHSDENESAGTVGACMDLPGPGCCCLTVNQSAQTVFPAYGADAAELAIFFIAPPEASQLDLRVDIFRLLICFSSAEAKFIKL